MQNTTTQASRVLEEFLNSETPWTIEDFYKAGTTPKEILNQFILEYPELIDEVYAFIVKMRNERGKTA